MKKVFKTKRLELTKEDLFNLLAGQAARGLVSREMACALIVKNWAEIKEGVFSFRWHILERQSPAVLHRLYENLQIDSYLIYLKDQGIKKRIDLQESIKDKKITNLQD